LPACYRLDIQDRLPAEIIKNNTANAALSFTVITRGEIKMHYVISATWGPTDTTRAALPFIFAESAMQAGDTVMIMLFHDAVTIAVDGSYQKMIPVGPPPKFAEVLSNPDAKVLVCKPCAEARGIKEEMLVKNCNLAGMNDFHKEASMTNTKTVTF